MISSEVQRTLVKSPPELWAELSDPDSLARHLGELGEIRITRAEPEKRVEWEAEGTNGSVSIKPSGWGTKVTISVTREIEAPQDASEIEQDVEPPAVAELQPEPVVEAGERPEASADAVEPEAPPEAEIVAPDVVESQPEIPTFEAEIPEAAEAVETTREPTSPGEPTLQPAPRRGFFARLFGRREPKVTKPVEATSAEPAAATPADDAPLQRDEAPADLEPATRARSSSAIESLQARFQAEPASEPVVEAGPAPQPEPVAAQAEQPAEPVAEAPESSEEAQKGAAPRDLSAELKAVEEVAAEEVTAVLTAVLDRLGAAHHRPFSRA